MIELANISFSYPERPVLRDVNLRVRRGEYIGVTGDNGSGKTTFVKLLNGLLLPHKGRVVVNGVSTSDRGSLLAIRRSVGIVFQNPDAQAVGETVEEDIVFGLENVRVPIYEIDRRIERYLGMLGIKDLRDRNISLLSGGQKQLVNIAAVMAMEPACIVFDEALSMLDAGNRRNVLLRISELNRRGTLIIQITHNPEDLSNCHRVITISEGRISSQRSVGGAEEANKGKEGESAVVSWVHNNAIDINDISKEYSSKEYSSKEYNHRGHSGARRVGFKTLCSLCPPWLNPVAFTACVGSIRPQQRKKKRDEDFRDHRIGPGSGIFREGCGIEILRLSHTYNSGTDWKVPALRDLSLTIGKGRITGIVGGIGSGKSTLACLIAGLDTPTSGSIVIDGKPPEPGGSVRILFQHPEEFFFERTVREAVAFGLSKARLPEDAVGRRILSAIDGVGLDRSILGESPFKLSSGEQRLAAFACVIAVKPVYVVLDEPTAGLDRRSRRLVLDAIMRMAGGEGGDGGVTIIYISHRIREVLKVADRIAVLDAGNLTFDGTSAMYRDQV
ncbi:MAG: energy-coupling factor transporter ATPase [Euryarchaeota archaeon]|nr:energy-coupling factor transporter ATPase [Euryarchaeota archaeon]